MTQFINGAAMTHFSVENFESSAKQNGIRYWAAHEFMEKLGYENWASFKSVINKAISLCARVGVDSIEAFIQLKRWMSRARSSTLCRFGCLLVTMQADQKPEVAQAQVAMAAVQMRWWSVT